MNHVKDVLLLLWHMVPPQDHDDGSEKMSARHYKWRKATTIAIYLQMIVMAVVVGIGISKTASAGDFKALFEVVKANTERLGVHDRQLADQQNWQQEERRRNLERTVTELQIQRCRSKQPLRDIFGKQFDQAWAAYRELPNADDKFVPPTCPELG